MKGARHRSGKHRHRRQTAGNHNGPGLLHGQIRRHRARPKGPAPGRSAGLPRTSRLTIALPDRIQALHIPQGTIHTALSSPPGRARGCGSKGPRTANTTPDPRPGPTVPDQARAFPGRTASRHQGTGKHSDGPSPGTWADFQGPAAVVAPGQDCDHSTISMPSGPRHQTPASPICGTIFTDSRMLRRPSQEQS